MRQLRLVLLLSLMTLVLSCTRDGTTTGNPMASFKVNGSSQSAMVVQFKWLHEIFDLIVPTAVAAPALIEDSGGRTVTLDHFWTTLGEVEFKLSETSEVGEVDGEEVQFEGPYTFDILVTNVDPVASVRLSLNRLRRVKVKLIRTLTLPAGAPVALTNNSIYISGTVNGVAFSFSTQDETVVEVGGPNLVEIPNGSELLLQFHIANIFKKMDLGSITVPTDISDANRVNVANPCPLIDASANDLFTCFRKGIETQANFGRDNGDDELDGSDDTVK